MALETGGITIGFIGLGVMGEPMCRNLAKKSSARVLAFDTQAEHMARLASDGVLVASSIGDIARQAQVIFLSLPSGNIVEQVCRQSEGLLANAQVGQLIVDLSTSPVALTRELASAFTARGASFVDAPVARTRAAAEAGTLSVMVGAADEDFLQIKPLLACMASDISLCGPVGCGQVLKIMNNMVLFETVMALSEAAAMAEQAGVNRNTLFEVLSKGSADSFALRNHGMKAMLPRHFPEKAFSVIYAQKDLHYALELAQSLGIEARGARLVNQLFDEAIAKGFGEKYHPVISEVVASRKGATA